MRLSPKIHWTGHNSEISRILQQTFPGPQNPTTAEDLFQTSVP